MEKIISFFMAIIAFFASLFGINLNWGNNNKPTTEQKDGIVFVQNVAYGTAAREVMDVAYPAAASGYVDVILDVHGGAWIAGSKDSESNLIKSAAQLGYIGAAMNYTYISENTHCDTILNEITMALKFLKTEAANLGVTVRKYIILGGSAGGHLSTLYAYSRGAESGVAPAAVFNMCGPNALEYIAQMPEFYTGNPLGSTEYICKLISWLCGVTVTTDNINDPIVKEALSQVSATHFIDTAVPTITCHGQKDTVVPYQNAVILNNMLEAKGVRHDLIPFPNSGHGLESDPDKTNEAYALLIQYAADYLSAYKG